MADQFDEIKARDEQAAEYESFYSSKGHCFGLVEHRSVMEFLGSGKDDIILDVGCGTGRFTRPLARKAKRVHAIDFSLKSLELLESKASEEGLMNIVTHEVDITKKLDIGEQVDRILSIQVIQHIPTPESRQIALRNLYDILKVGGTCVISVYNWTPFFSKGQAKDGKFDNNITYTRFTPGELVSLFESASFRDVQVRGCVNFRWYEPLEKKGLREPLKPIAAVDSVLSKFSISSKLGFFLMCKGVK